VHAEGGDHALDRWIDRAAIRDHVESYADAVDGKDWARYRSLFTQDARLDYTGAWGIAGSVDEVASWLSRLADPSVNPMSHHVISNIRVVVDGDEATASAYYLTPAVLADEGGATSMVVNTGRYEIALRRRPSGWRISRFVVTSTSMHRAEVASFEPRVAPEA